jgi:hypothetical protein
MVTKNKLYEWCRIQAEDLPSHPDLNVPFRLAADSEAMGELMARELVDGIKGASSRAGRSAGTRRTCG